MKNIYSSLFFLFSFALLNAQQVIYVDHSATGNNDGSRWDDAYTGLNAALGSASQNDTIWVAQGTYLPGVTPSASFLIDLDLVLLGGFRGDETSDGERDPDLYETILSGDLNQDDIPDDFENNRGDNVITVLVIESNVTNETLIDGFTISGGHSDGTGNFWEPSRSGGGVYSYGAPNFQHCTFEQNYSSNHGGAAYFAYPGDELLEVSQCTFQNNYARRGAGLNIENSDCEVSDCFFTGNIATQHGGGFRYSSSENNHSATLRDCIIEDNHSTFGGGARLEAQADTDNNHLVVVDCQFTGNSVAQLTPEWSQSGGGLNIAIWPGTFNNSALVDNCQFEQNRSTGYAGAADLVSGGENTTFELRNSTFLNNTTAFGATASIWGSNEGTGTAWVDSCHFENNVAAYGGGMDFAALEDGGFAAFEDGGADYVFNLSNSSFISNVAWEGGALNIWQDIVSKVECYIERCTMTNNVASIFGGAIATFPHNSDYHITVRQSVITDNQSPVGAAISADPWFVDVPLPDSASILVENSLVARNIGPSIFSAKRLPNLGLLNCTVAGNDGVGVVLADESGLSLQNTILYNPGNAELEIVGGTISSRGGNLLSDNSLSEPHPSDRLEVLDPLFVAADDFNLADGSPAIDKGIDPGNLTEFDLAGNDRINRCVDIGAYESNFTGTDDCIMVGVDKFPLEQRLSISPNPVRDFLNIQLPEAISGSMEAGIFDVQGRLMVQYQISTGQPVDIRNLEAGIYLVKAMVDERTYVGRFVKL